MSFFFHIFSDGDCNCSIYIRKVMCVWRLVVPSELHEAAILYVSQATPAFHFSGLLLTVAYVDVMDPSVSTSNREYVL